LGYITFVGKLIARQIKGELGAVLVVGADLRVGMNLARPDAENGKTESRDNHEKDQAFHRSSCLCLQG
jgi:hypothetical protein